MIYFPKKTNHANKKIEEKLHVSLTLVEIKTQVPPRWVYNLRGATVLTTFLNETKSKQKTKKTKLNMLNKEINRLNKYLAKENAS